MRACAKDILCVCEIVNSSVRVEVDETRLKMKYERKRFLSFLIVGGYLFLGGSEYGTFILQRPFIYLVMEMFPVRVSVFYLKNLFW